MDAGTTPLHSLQRQQSRMSHRMNMGGVTA
jgi:hypothetical protein